MKIVLAECVIVDEYDRILLLHRSGSDTPQWELPGGQVEQDEVPEAVAVEEVRRQLGVDIRLTAHLGSGEYEADDDEYHAHWFQARIQVHQPKLSTNGVHDDFSYFDMEDMMSLALSPSTHLLLAKIFDGELALEPGDEV